ncbi:tRNA 2-thiouridine(34) synthase MnmA [Panacagrimonas sp.]|uniref:tRNA 2-thiouridine(34) synthase MnmA n=1 Tax=Panacagrimonas sp. TaxID=2480088 RepID=UPI003B524C0F
MSAPHVIVGLSGGVDSAVAAWRLKDQGYRVSGLFMQNWTEDEQGYCTAAEDFQSARAVAEELSIPLHRVDFSAEYRERVFAHFLDDYRAGRTPNPDLLCNREVKFQPFREHALRLGADFVATGHYARLHDGALLRSVTEDKDQTYFLALVAREHFERVLFPIGDLAKPEVRELARKAGLPNHRRKDSTGICFIGERPFREFLQHYLQPNPGPMVDDAGTYIGEHQGLMFYTLGQRRGLSIGGRRGARQAPWYVAAKRLADNTLVVTQDAHHPLLMSTRLRTCGFSWIERPTEFSCPLHARIRHRQALQACSAEALPDGSVEVRFEQPQRAVSPGQYCVLYDGERCLGGGEIENSVS